MRLTHAAYLAFTCARIICFTLLRRIIIIHGRKRTNLFLRQSISICEWLRYIYVIMHNIYIYIYIYIYMYLYCAWDHIRIQFIDHYIRYITLESITLRNRHGKFLFISDFSYNFAWDECEVDDDSVFPGIRWS